MTQLPPVTDQPSASPGARWGTAPTERTGEIAVTFADQPMPPVRWRLVGPEGAPVVAVLGGISANADFMDRGETKGWWRDFCGPGKSLDTSRLRVLGFDWVAPYDMADDMPPDIASTRRQSDVLAQILDEAGIDRLAAVVGSSFGGQVALHFATWYADRLDRLVIIGAAHRNHPMATGWRETQRQIVLLGIRAGRGSEALAVARQLAMTTYRSVEEFGQRFTAAPRLEDGWIRWDVSDYLVSRGKAFAATQTPGRWLALSLAIDLHKLDPARITLPVQLYACRQDRLVPIAVMRELAAGLGGPVEWHEYPSIYGHDSFLKETAVFTKALSRLTHEVCP